MLMIHTNLIKKCKNNPDSTECAGQATKMNMCLFYNKRKQKMYGSKSNSICTRCCVYSSLKLIIYRVQRQKTKCSCLVTKKQTKKQKLMWNKAKLNSAVKYESQREQNYRSEIYTICKGVLNNEWGWKFKQLLRGLNLELSGQISLRFQLS